MKKLCFIIYLLGFNLLFIACNDDDSEEYIEMEEEDEIVDPYQAIKTTFPNTIDLENLYNYANQTIPDYITKDNTGSNGISNLKATLGRILFYDKNLSKDNTISCASCHKQEFAFGDNLLASPGVNGNTGRHSMRLVNARFGEETKFFWDERAETLEAQVILPIQNHVEMGFSGEDGFPAFEELFPKLEAIDYYQEFFELVYGDQNITPERLQECLAQFVRSIQSFDTKFDEGFAQVTEEFQPFPNFTFQENQGKLLFLRPPPNGGAGCTGCHRMPEFDIDPEALNNGIIGVIGNQTEKDIIVTRSPTLREIFNQNNELNGPMMHSGVFTSFEQVVNHYNSISVDPDNTNLDPRLSAGGNGQNLNLTEDEKAALVAFLKTLSGKDVYTNPKWSDPFENN
ncbi:cytochrome-c peroxidase [Aureivirga marina]|uniref:cytochrome-c peroxidase n=1 Tax=Aureivirga marina TaxID=1182451 RepID=UPI0018CA67DC|nr:cytochrome c peroxidase [Aureivirga marina]